MSAALKKLIKRGMLFSIPFLLYGLLVLAVDPFNYFKTGSLISNDLKEDISLKINYSMWKMLKYRQEPVPNILLGDSRMMSIDDQLVSKTAGEPYVNMAYGGGSLREAIDTFWFTSELGQLKNVYFGININSYNGRNNKDRVSEVLAAVDNQLLYFTNTNILIAGKKLIQASITGHKGNLGVPDMDKDTFWNHQLEVTTRVYLSSYSYPKEYRDELIKISEYCRENAINLNFVLFPNHADFQEKIRDYKLTQSLDNMRSDLQDMGRVFDFAFKNSITEDRNNFRDPYHFNQEIGALIVECIWSEPSEIVKTSGRSTVN